MKRTYRVQFRRKRSGETNYRKRLKLLLSSKLRLVVRKSLKNIQAQIIEYNPDGDRVTLSVHSRELEKFDWKINKGNMPASYLVGLLIAKKAKKKGIDELILDMGLNKSVKGSRIYTLLKGVVDGGINIAHSDSILPSKERLSGEHIAKYASLLKKDDKEYEKKFSGYIKNKIEPTNLNKYFEEVKKKIMGAD